MATWGLIVESTVGGGERKHVESYVLAHVEGEREVNLLHLRTPCSRRPMWNATRTAYR
ncbi:MULTISPECIES: hypothetical protein [Streptomyces]|uniref:hypothetical protein n=1 Tax=Streptomyces TaxID=1883 RepID=UPI00345C2E8B